MNLHEDFKNNRYWNLIGIRMKELNPGHVRLTMEVKDELIQLAGVLHGGATASLMDSAMGVSVWSLNMPDVKGLTVEMKINYLLPVLPGDELEAEAKVIHNGNTLAVSSAEVRNREGKLVSYGTATFILIKNGA
ncbi:MAG: PaaI family thioesterase [Bacillota bacterium]